MRKEYDFSKIKGRKNPYAKKLKQQITIRIEIDQVEGLKLGKNSSFASDRSK